jgi:hypothetical protein
LKIQREHKCWFNINRRSDWHKWLWSDQRDQELNSDVIIITQSAFGLNGAKRYRQDLTIILQNQ